jgi:hypothetical protein
MASSNEQNQGIYGRYWDTYVEKRWPKVKAASGEVYEWPGDEWGSPEVWESIHQELFVPSGVREWQRAVEIGPGSGKYTLKVLEGSRATIRAYDVSAQYISVCETRCQEWIKQERLSMHLLGIARADQMLTDLTGCGWRRTVDAFYSIGAMVHVDLQYLIVYLVTAGMTLKRGGKLILTLADASGETGFQKLLNDIRWYYPAQDKPNPKYEWLSPDLVQSILPRLGFETNLLSNKQRDLYVVATLARPELADDLHHYLLPAS